MKQNIKTSGYISLLLLLPAPTIGVIAGMYLWPGPMGQLIWSASKLWMILLPLMWLIMIDRGSVSLSPMKRGGWLAGLVSGLIIFIAILITYYLFGRRWIDTQYVCQMMIDLGLSSRSRYISLCIYWIFVNSVLEEYVWRWFAFTKCDLLMSSAWAVILSATMFTLHHVLALNIYFDLHVTIIASAGVFIGGATWSCLYLYYRSIWPGWLSHAWADLAIFIIGYKLLFIS